MRVNNTHGSGKWRVKAGKTFDDFIDSEATDAEIVAEPGQKRTLEALLEVKWMGGTLATTVNTARAVGKMTGLVMGFVLYAGLWVLSVVLVFLVQFTLSIVRAFYQHADEGTLEDCRPTSQQMDNQPPPPTPTRTTETTTIHHQKTTYYER